MVIFKKIIHLLADFCYLFIIVYAILCAPMVFRYKPLVVLSGSMEPTFPVGSIIYSMPVTEDKLEKGDIITFKLSDGTYVSHRINNIENGLYETKGDANDSADPNKIKYSDIVGKDMNICIPYMGYYVQFINTHMFIVVIVVIILVLEFLFSNIDAFNIKGKKGVNKNEK